MIPELAGLVAGVEPIEFVMLTEVVADRVVLGFEIPEFSVSCSYEFLRDRGGELSIFI